MATYVRSGLGAINTRTLFDEVSEDGRVLGLAVEVTVLLGDVPVRIMNYHGISRPKHKDDSEERIEQCQKMVRVYGKPEGSTILGGDFNFLPTTQSYKQLKGDTYRELIMENHIPTTRNELYWDRRGLEHKYSDYCFVSPEIKIESFTVPDIRVSDHLPMILEFSVHA